MKANMNESDKGSSHSQDALGRPEGNLKSVLALKHGTYDKVDTACVLTRNEEALPKILSDIEMSDRQQIPRAVQVKEEQGYSPTAECGLMLRPEEISGCTDTPENVAERGLVVQNSPSETVEGCLFHADDLKFTTWRGQEMNEITQVQDPGVDESSECVATYTADEIPGVEVTAVNVSNNSSVTYPIVEIPGVDVELDVEVTGVNKDLDAEPTGVVVDTGVAYGREAYDAVPQDQGNKTKVYGLGQQVPKEGKEHKEMKHKTAMARVIMLLLNLMMLVTLTETTKAGVTKALLAKKGGVDAEIAIQNETLHWHMVAGTQKEHVLDTVLQDMVTRDRVSMTDHASDRGRMRDRVSEKSLQTTKRVRGPPESLRTIKESLRIGCEQQIDYVTKGDVSSPMVLEYAEIGGPKNRVVIDGTGANECMLGADKKVSVGREIPGVSLGYYRTREIKVVAGCTISWQSVDEDVDDGRKLQLTRASGREGCLRQKEAQRNHAGNRSTRMSTPRAKSCGRSPSATMKVQVILAAGNEVSDERRQRVRMMTARSTNACWPSTMRSTMESTGVTPGYDKSRRVKMKNAAVKLIILDPQNDYDNVGESTGVDMHAHEVARHEVVSPMDQKVGGFRIKCKIADFGQHVKGTIKLTAGEAEYADEAVVHGYIPWRDSTVDGMIVRGLLNHESGCEGMQEHTFMCIASVDGECYDSARARGESKMSKTEGVSLRFARSRYAGRYSCVNGTTISRQLLMAKERGLALTEERHSGATDQVRVEDNTHQVGNDGEVVTILDWMVPGICSRCVAMRLDLQGIHEDRGGMVISSGMGQKCVRPEAASKTYGSKVVHKSVKIMDTVMKWLRT
jgi:hypothetical protein